MSLKEDLQAALTYLGPNGENWTTGTYGRKGMRRCAAGACMEVCDASESQSPATLMRRLQLVMPEGFSCIEEFNDEPGRTFADIKAVFEKAIAAAEEVNV